MEENRTTDAFRPAGGRLLQQSVLKHIRRKADGVKEGAAIGYDAAIFQNGDNLIVQAVGAQPTARIPADYPLTAGELAWITAENQLAACGVYAATAETAHATGSAGTAEAAATEAGYASDREMTAGTAATEAGRVLGAEVLLVAGSSCPEEVIRREMQRIAAFATARGCPIVGGNTVWHGEGTSCLVQVVMTGSVPEYEVMQEKPADGTAEGDAAQAIPADGTAESGVMLAVSDPGNFGPQSRRKPMAQDRVFFLGETGCLGADILVHREKERLSRRFSESYIDTMRYEANAFSVAPLCKAALDAGAVFLHDVSNGGVHAALYQLAEAAGCGIAVRHEGLTIRQSVIELSEALGINPYQLLGTGGLLAVVPEERAEAFISQMNGTGIRIGDAGRLTKEKARIVRAESFPMERYLNLPEGDVLDTI